MGYEHGLIYIFKEEQNISEIFNELVNSEHKELEIFVQAPFEMWLKETSNGAINFDCYADFAISKISFYIHLSAVTFNKNNVKMMLIQSDDSNSGNFFYTNINPNLISEFLAVFVKMNIDVENILFGHGMMPFASHILEIYNSQGIEGLIDYGYNKL